MLFQIEDKEYELKLNFKGVQHLNSVYQGGAMELIGRTILADLDTFTHVIHSALLHTKENIAFKKVEDQVEKLFDEGTLDSDYISKFTKELVLEHFFYKPLLTKLVNTDKTMAKQLEEFLK